MRFCATMTIYPPKNIIFKGDITMKKMTKLIALALVLALSVVMLASCFGPNADPEKAIAALAALFSFSYKAGLTKHHNWYMMNGMDSTSAK